MRGGPFPLVLLRTEVDSSSSRYSKAVKTLTTVAFLSLSWSLGSASFLSRWFLSSDLVNFGTGMSTSAFLLFSDSAFLFEKVEREERREKECDEIGRVS